MARGHIIFLLCLVTIACDESKMRSSGNGGNSTENNNTTDDSAGLPLLAPCSANGEVSTTENRIEQPPATEYTFTGEVCPKGVGAMDIAFIVDFSQSMEFPAHLVNDYGKGNDPTTDGSCARLQAAKAVIANVKARLSANDQVRISVIPFSSDVIEDAKVTNINLAQFDSYLSTKYFCGTNELTNYAAGLNEANKILSASTVKYKVAYFITDGKPYILKLDANGNPIPRTDGKGNQVDGPKAQQEGRTAMTALRSANQNLNFYSVFLGNKVEDPKEAVAYLNEISGAENVKVASDASKLAEEIVKFSLPGLTLNQSSASAKLDNQPLKIKRVYMSPKGNNIWNLETEKFTPAGENSVITMEVKTSDGRVIKLGATLTPGT